MKVFENRGNNLIEKWYLRLRSGTGPLFLENCLKKAVGKTAVCTAERKYFLVGFSARATNTLQLVAYETKVFVVCGENPRMEKAILRMGWSIFALEFAKCVKQFLLLGKLLCAVTEAYRRQERNGRARP